MEQKEYQKMVLFNKWLHLVKNTPPDFPWLILAIKPDNTKLGLTVTQAEIQGKKVIIQTKELGQITITTDELWIFINGKTYQGNTIWTEEI